MPAADRARAADHPPITVTEQLEAFLRDVAAGFGITYEEALRREAWRQVLVPLTVAVNTDRDVFAEVHRSTDGSEWHTVVNYTGDLRQAQSRVAHLVPPGADVRWRQVEKSAAWFDRELRSGVAATLMSAHRQYVAAIGHDVSRNVINVITNGEQPHVDKLYVEAYGQEAVAFERIAADGLKPIVAAQHAPSPRNTNDGHGTGCSDRFDCARWRGALQIHRENEYGATTNMWAKRWNGSAWVYYILFSGHAAYRDATGKLYTWRHANISIGTMTRNSLWEAATKNIYGEWETNSDSSRVFVADSAHYSLRNNWFYQHPGEKTYDLTYKLKGTMYAVGDAMCKAGIGYLDPVDGNYHSCGAVLSKSNVVWTSRCCEDTANVKVYNLARADFNGSAEGYGLAGGDSGAIVHGGWEYNGSGAGWAGIAGPNTGGFFSKPDRIESDLNVIVCLNLDCSN